MREIGGTRRKNDLNQLVTLVEYLAWRDGLVEKDEALKIKLNEGLVSGALWWDVSELPPETRQRVLDMIEQIRMGTHPALTDPNYKSARNGEPDSGLPFIVKSVTF